MHYSASLLFTGCHLELCRHLRQDPNCRQLQVLETKKHLFQIISKNSTKGNLKGKINQNPKQKIFQNIEKQINWLTDLEGKTSNNDRTSRGTRSRGQVGRGENHQGQDWQQGTLEKHEKEEQKREVKYKIQGETWEIKQKPPNNRPWQRAWWRPAFLPSQNPFFIFFFWTRTIYGGTLWKPVYLQKQDSLLGAHYSVKQATFWIVNPAKSHTPAFYKQHGQLMGTE